MKTEFIYFQTKKHFKTILLTCNLAILIYHILEQKLNADDFHFTTREILDALNGMNLFKLKDVGFASNYECSDNILERLCNIFSLELNKEAHRIDEIKKY